MGDAAGKAKKIAEALGVTITGPTYASTSIQYEPYMRTYSALAETPVIPGEVQVTATVQVKSNTASSRFKCLCIEWNLNNMQKYGV